ncbi:phosphopantetheine-binding protein [Streptomyces hundungensis]|uniref:phosphopantetheine-binding protein n=1 Tax=Streptomyces hundungensis TaxID=1077946 RepID=UPI0033CFFAAF
MPVEEVSENVTEGSAEREIALGIDAIWKEILGADADVESGFIANGGDSLMAVLLADRIFASTGREIDYLEILDAPDSATLARIVIADDRDR